MIIYLWTNTSQIDFPPEFVGSKNKRFIVIEQCKAIDNDTLIGDIILHVDFIEREQSINYLLTPISGDFDRKQVLRTNWRDFVRYNFRSNNIINVFCR